MQFKNLKHIYTMSKLPEYPDGLHPLDTVLFLKALDFGSRSREKGKSHSCQNVINALWVSLSISCFILLTGRELIFDYIKCITYLTSCNLSGYTGATSSQSIYFSLRVLWNL